ncbi:V3 [Wild vitis virus 1]|uniref:V3 n=1 Tax=Wild vitis virus 1 TaxID=2025352 RepID=A0A223FPN7_9GEMI|nr:V3 [Wild vitis virus 1]AST09902.1 V3 [Wild vitis virus 1]AST09932.1 V3 [Wild vitis virus 1]AST09938.1 V3 [Wild vitis virus 1]
MEVFFNRPRCLIWRCDISTSYVDGDIVIEGEHDVPIMSEDEEMVNGEVHPLTELLRKRRRERDPNEIEITFPKRRRVYGADAGMTDVDKLKNYIYEDDYVKHKRRLDLELGSGLHRPDSRCNIM